MPASEAVTVDDGRLKHSAQAEGPGVQKSEFFVFVGEKIEVAEVPPADEEIRSDYPFDARYRVLESVYRRASPGPS